MLTTRSLLAIAVSAAALACGNAHEPSPTAPKAAGVDVSIASVTLANDCGGGPRTPPPEPAETKVAAAGSMTAKVAADMEDRPRMARERACEQSSVQLRVANTTDAAAKVTVQSVELFDPKGVKLADLAPRAPSRWAGDGYQAWDEQVAASETAQVSYALSVPGMERGVTYTVRVVVATADGPRALEHKTTMHVEASLPPGVVT
jgi:hypothetical protein